MPITKSDGTQSVGTTEHSLPRDATHDSGQLQIEDCIAQIWIDTANIAAGDEFQVKVYEKINGGTLRVAHTANLVGAQIEPWISPSLVLADGWDVTIKKIAGTDRTIDWSIRKVS